MTFYNAHCLRNLAIGMSLGFGLTASTEAQDAPPTEPPIMCDWAAWSNSPSGMATQLEHDGVEASWECPSNKSVIDYIWRGFDFDSTTWAVDPNNGFEFGCDARFPVGRALNGSVLLGYSSTNTPNCDVKNDNVLDWAVCWTVSTLDELRTSCIPVSDALAQTGTFVFDTETWLNPSAMYEQEVERLAATIFHEARHWDCGHNADDDECKRGASCDDTWADGCPWPSNGGGANRFQVAWLSWFANRGVRGTQFLKDDAVIRANSILSTAFAHDPCFRLAPDGSKSNTKPPGC